MYTSVKLLNTIKRTYRLPSDYAAAKLLGVTTSCLSKIRCGHNEFSVDTALRISELLELEPLKIIGSVRVCQAKRQRDKDTINQWKKYI